MSSPLARLHLIAAHEAPELAGVPAGTVRRWASEGDPPLLAARGLDSRDRPLYDLADVLRLRDRRRHAMQQRVVDRAAMATNTAADGSRVSTPGSGPRR